MKNTSHHVKKHLKFNNNQITVLSMYYRLQTLFSHHETPICNSTLAADIAQ